MLAFITFVMSLFSLSSVADQGNQDMATLEITDKLVLFDGFDEKFREIELKKF